MIEIPDNVRQTLAVLRKYHFWILALLLPAILVPLLTVANGGLEASITARKREIDGKLGQVRNVTGVVPHPNRQWSAAIEDRVKQVGDETLREWSRLWDSQEPLRVWPAELGPEFLAAVAALRPGGQLERPALLNYQRRVQRFARGLPARMGVPDEMSERPQAAAGPDLAQRSGPRPPCTWNAADQQRLFASFSWTRPPSTDQVLLAQQELWVYGQFCDIIREFNEGATGYHDAAVALVDRLAVGYPAAEDAPGGRDSGRIFVPAPPRPTGPDRDRGSEPAGQFDFTPSLPPDAAGMAGEPAVGRQGFQRPAHGRFGDGREGADRPPQDQWNWAFVDFAGQPLFIEELATAPGVDMVRLMPFILRVVMDQRQLDRLLVKLAEWPIPVDVRQVRINPGSESGSGGGGRRRSDDPFGPGPYGSGGPSTGQPGEAASPRRYDVVVELRGTVALATPPGSSDSATPADAADAPQPEAF